MSDEGTPPPASAPAPAAPQPAGATGFDDVSTIRKQIAEQALVSRSNEQEFLTSVAVNELRLRLRDFEGAIKDRDAWKAPAGLSVGLLSTLITVKATPDGFSLFSLSRETLIGALGFALPLSVLWSLLGVWKAWGWLVTDRWKGSSKKGIKTGEDVIRDLRGRSSPPQ